MTVKGRVKFDTTYAICLLPVLVFSLFWWTRPFADRLSENECRINHLTGPQKTNISLAAHKLNDIIIKPHESFSFNKIVGPRTIERGFLEAPSYENGKTIMTEGGGVCLLSSLVYKSALEAGLKVTSRQPHSRIVQSVKPGFDATVMYGRYDLKFVNDTEKPITLKSTCDGSSCKVSILGTKLNSKTRLLSTMVSESQDHVLVSVYKSANNQLTLLTSDSYRK